MKKATIIKLTGDFPKRQQYTIYGILTQDGQTDEEFKRECETLFLKVKQLIEVEPAPETPIEP